jgi:hypothetical protein
VRGRIPEIFGTGSLDGRKREGISEITDTGAPDAKEAASSPGVSEPDTADANEALCKSASEAECMGEFAGREANDALIRVSSAAAGCEARSNAARSRWVARAARAACMVVRVTGAATAPP